MLQPGGLLLSNLHTQYIKVLRVLIIQLCFTQSGMYQYAAAICELSFKLVIKGNVK
jgi:hypothetical protein